MSDCTSAYRLPRNATRPRAQRRARRGGRAHERVSRGGPNSMVVRPGGRLHHLRRKASCRVFVCVTRICGRFGKGERGETRQAPEGKKVPGLGSEAPRRGDRAGSGEARRTSLAFIRIRSRRAPHVGQSTRPATRPPVDPPALHRLRRREEKNDVRGWFPWKRARERLGETSERERAPAPIQDRVGPADAFPDSRAHHSHPARASPRARRLCRARPERPPKHAI